MGGETNGEMQILYSENLRVIRIQWVLNFLPLLEIVEQRMWSYSLVSKHLTMS